MNKSSGDPYLTGFIAPVEKSTGAADDDPDRREEIETDAGELAEQDKLAAVDGVDGIVDVERVRFGTCRNEAQ